MLRELYAWYRRTERTSTNVRRDRELLPALDALMADTGDVRTAALADALAAGVRTAPREFAPPSRSRSTSGPGGASRARA